MAENVMAQMERPRVRPNEGKIYLRVKRTLDIVGSLGGIVVLSPVFLAAAAAVFLDDPGSVIFKQKRNGQGNRVFEIYKFRSMCRDAPKMQMQMQKLNELKGPAFKMKDDPRVTRVGKFLRRTSIDELPQLFNVLRGEMSLVGPRPLPTYETEQLAPWQRQRLLVKPGLTCYWQISGRNDVEFDEWMEMDCRYIADAGIWTDMRIILKTITAVIKRKGAY